jgi:hypothetical protein
VKMLEEMNTAEALRKARPCNSRLNNQDGTGQYKLELVTPEYQAASG